MIYNTWDQDGKNLPTVDGRNPANQLRLVVYPIMYRVVYIPGGARSLPSTVSAGVLKECMLAQYERVGRTIL